MNKQQEIKLMILENFVDHFTSDDNNRKAYKEIARQYVEEDHVDEISQAFPETIKADKCETHKKLSELLSRTKS